MVIQPVRILKIPLSGLTFAPLFGKYLAHMYQKADYVITPSEYSKHLIQSYGVTTPIIAVSNGIDLEKYKKDPKKEEVFRKHFNIQEGQKVVICAGLYFKRKGIEDFVEVARRMPDVRFIWLGSINKWIIPRKIRRIVEKDHPVMWNSLATSREQSSKGL